MTLIDRLLDLPFPVLNHWGYWFILIMATLEASPIFSILIPGQLIIIIGGFLAKLGILNLYETIFVAASGAILGDLIGYSIGRRYGYSFITRYGKYFFFKKKHFEKTKRLMNHHTGKTLIIGRFNSLTRAFAPFVAGSTEVPFFRFIVYNMIGGISWAACYVIIGYVFGRGYEVASRYVEEFVFFIFIAMIIIIYLYRFVKKRKQVISE